MKDRQTPPQVAQRAKVSQMSWNDCMAQYTKIDSRNKHKSDCGAYTIYPGNETPYQTLLAERMAFLEHHERIRRINRQRYSCGRVTA